jgi:hypothetical protein
MDHSLYDIGWSCGQNISGFNFVDQLGYGSQVKNSYDTREILA